MNLFDTHCHIHEIVAANDPANPTHGLWLKSAVSSADDVVAAAAQAGVQGMICVGTTAADSELAVAFVQDRPQCWASIGVHPHEAKSGSAALQRIARLLEGDQTSSLVASTAESPYLVEPLQNSVLSGRKEGGHERAAQRALMAGGLKDEAQDVMNSGPKIVAIGECGLDYYYSHSPKVDQIKALRFQIELALQHDLPLIFHVRDAFDDFWQIFDSYQGLRGVVHSFTDTQKNLEKLLNRGLFVGINGIMSFTKHEWQLEVAKAIPLERLVLETDAPFLTPAPLRGKVNTPANICLVAEFLANLRGESPEALAKATTHNAFALFKLIANKNLKK